MYYLKESSLGTTRPIYQKLDEDETFLFPERQIAFDFASRGVYERSLIDWACEQFVDPSKNAIDIGAHIGTYTLPFAKKASHVYSFECCPRTYNFLCGNIAMRNLDYKVTPHKVALGNSNGSTSFFIRNEDGGGNGCMEFGYDRPEGSRKITVDVKTLDSFNLENVGFIKIDVEGLEKQVLEGAVETLKRNNYPKILFESWTPDNTRVPAVKLRTELFDYINSIGYHIIPIRGNGEMFLATYG